MIVISGVRQNIILLFIIYNRRIDQHSTLFMAVVCCCCRRSWSSACCDITDIRPKRWKINDDWRSYLCNKLVDGKLGRTAKRNRRRSTWEFDGGGRTAKSEIRCASLRPPGLTRLAPSRMALSRFPLSLIDLSVSTRLVALSVTTHVCAVFRLTSSCSCTLLAVSFTASVLLQLHYN